MISGTSIWALRFQEHLINRERVKWVWVSSLRLRVCLCIWVLAPGIYANPWIAALSDPANQSCPRGLVTAAELIRTLVAGTELNQISRPARTKLEQEKFWNLLRSKRNFKLVELLTRQSRSQRTVAYDPANPKLTEELSRQFLRALEFPVEAISGYYTGYREWLHFQGFPFEEWTADHLVRAARLNPGPYDTRKMALTLDSNIWISISKYKKETRIEILKQLLSSLQIFPRAKEHGVNLLFTPTNTIEVSVPSQSARPQGLRIYLPNHLSRQLPRGYWDMRQELAMRLHRLGVGKKKSDKKEEDERILGEREDSIPNDAYIMSELLTSTRLDQDSCVHATNDWGFDRALSEYNKRFTPSEQREMGFSVFSGSEALPGIGHASVKKIKMEFPFKARVMIISLPKTKDVSWIGTLAKKLGDSTRD